MKKTAILLLLLFAAGMAAQAQDNTKQLKEISVDLVLLNTMSSQAQDSVKIEFIYLNRELTLLNALNDIQYTGFRCSDTRAKGKKFLVWIEKYKNGETVSSDSADIMCKEELMSITVEGKSVNYHFDLCSKKTFVGSRSSYSVLLAGKLKDDDTFNLFINYPAVRLIKKLRGSANYSLRGISCETDNSAVIPSNKPTPVFAYTPPFDTGEGYGSFCILGTDDVRNWQNKLGIEHYYIFYLKIV